MKSAVASYQCSGGGGSLEMGDEGEMEDANKLFTELGMMILEGRTPEPSMKGRREGEHCPPQLGRSTHFCVSSDDKCKQMESVRAYICFLCKNDIPMSVEVLLYPNCCYGNQVEVEIGAAAESPSCQPHPPECSQQDHLLLEQWIVQVLPKRFSGAQCYSNFLFQAVRSFLHFSQLSAWLSSSQGNMASNIVYRVCAPGDLFSTDFISKPEIHTFPVLNVSKSSSLRVSVASLPRQSSIPALQCLEYAHSKLSKPTPLANEMRLFRAVGSDLYPVEPSLSKRQRSIEDLKFEIQKKTPTWRGQRHSSGEETSTSTTTSSSSGEEDQAELIRQKKAACAPKLEVVLPEVYRQQGAVPKSMQFKSQPDLGEDKLKYLGKSDWGLPPGTPASLYKTERSPPQTKRQLFCSSQPIPTLSRRDPDTRTVIRTKTPPVVEQSPNSGSLLVDTFNSQINKGQCNDKSHHNRHTPYHKELLVPNYYDSAFSSLQSINQQLSSLSLLECSTTDTCADTSSECTGDDEEEVGKEGQDDDDTDDFWQWSLDDRTTPRQRTSSDRTVSTEDDDDGITFCAKSKEPEEQFWEASSSWTDDEGVEAAPKFEPFGEVSDDDSFVSCFSNHNSYSDSPSQALTPRQLLEAQLRAQFKHRDETSPSSAPHIVTPTTSNSNSSSLAKSAKLYVTSSTKPSSPKHDVYHPSVSPIRTSGKVISCAVGGKDSPPPPHCSKASPVSSPHHQHRTRGFSLDSHDFTADIPAPFPKLVPAAEIDVEEPSAVCSESAFTPSFSKSKSLLRSVIGKENKPQGKKPHVETGVFRPVHSRSPPRSPDRNVKLRRSLDSSNTYVFHPRTGLPINSSPAPLRKTKTTNDCASLLKPGGTLKSSPSCNDLESEVHGTPLCQSTRVLSTSAPASTSCLLGNFEESVLNGRLEPLGTIDGFTAEIGASGSFCPKHIELPVTTFFYSVSDDDAPSSYFGYVNLEKIGRRGYHIPTFGTVQVTLFNPNKTVVKIFVVRYDLSDMPPNCQTFARQRIFYMPSRADLHDDVVKELRYLMHLRFQSSKSGKIYLHTDVRMIFARHTPDLESSLGTYELRSFTETPMNPRFSPKK